MEVRERLSLVGFGRRCQLISPISDSPDFGLRNHVIPNTTSPPGQGMAYDLGMLISNIILRGILTIKFQITKIFTGLHVLNTA